MSQTDPLVGLKVRMPSRCRCSTDAARIGPGTVTHRGSIRCSRCDTHRAWLSKDTAQWVQAVANKFGAPPLITLRTPRKQQNPRKG